MFKTLKINTYQQPLQKREKQALKARFLPLFILFLALFSTPLFLSAQDTVPASVSRQLPAKNSFPLRPNSLPKTIDSALSPSSGVADSLTDSSARRHLIALSPNAIAEIIDYKAADSVAINLNDRTAYLYHDGSIDYQSMSLKAESVIVDFNRQSLQARGTVDTNGKYQGRPWFKQDGTEYNADTILFNYASRKGVIFGVITQEGDGFLHGEKVKKVNDSVMYLNKGQYTTCNYAHPHFAINFSKSKLIAGNKIITGPAYLSIQDIPTPLALPFAFFPLSKDRSSGIIMPSYGWMNGRGYYLKDGGYYLALNDFVDLSLMGEIYTNLSWKGEVRSNYYRKYRYKGNIDVSYGRTRQGIRGDTNTFNIFSDFKIAWRHDQDQKANPNSRFSADVNLISRNYNRNTTNSADYFNSTTTSSISYTAQLGSAFNLATAFNESFNAQTGIMSIKLPSFSLSSITFYPLRRKEASGSYRWYENISMSYLFEGANNISVLDSNLLKKSTLSQMQYGLQHSIPIQSNIKVLKFFNWTNSLSYHERWHWSTINKHIDTSTQALIIDTIRGFQANRDFGFSSSLSTRIYGMFSFKYGPLKALRHVINPSLSFNFRPDFGAEKLGYWRSYTDSTGYVHRYSIFEQSLYGGPSDGRSGQLAFSVGNNLEAKIKPLRDTTDELKKIILIENLNLSMSYDIARDSLNWSDLNISGHTTLFRNLVLNYSGSFIPYVVDTLGNKHDILLWESQRKLFQRSNSSWSTQLAWSLNNSTFRKDKKGTSPSEPHPQLLPPIRQTPFNSNPTLLTGSYVDFSMPWNLSFNYTLSFVSNYVAKQYNFENSVIQTLSVTGNVSLTDHWKISATTGYDFTQKAMSYTSIDIYRDLHCWEMRFNWVPFGYYKSWNFIINIKANSLKDVKWEKRETYQGKQGYYSY